MQKKLETYNSFNPFRIHRNKSKKILRIMEPA
ncbi:hypothetical protein LSS_20820 [Leptospira santarosai serovar Shermani str. LT 821]|uniref:Uncharacterized protein n=1 Tax=Leptospira santarosai serovar Shermani str. LT 821 TaxID=758847 RepID=A0A097ES98_9LEPT|nr:hypothetical protein LSS_20820 [Leptospira santarosai serovar Shermani str. LT 821]